MKQDRCPLAQLRPAPFVQAAQVFKLTDEIEMLARHNHVIIVPDSNEQGSGG